MPQFPSDFVWGTATASYQVEGAAWEDGRGECIWDRFARTPGKVVNADNGDVACDHYHRYADDVKLMAALGLKAYRFSIAWPRILPLGKGRVNEKGLDFYDRLVDELLRAGITPFATLYHWDLPQALEFDGGWLNRETARHFADYTDIVTRALGDRVKHWMTFNEPLCITQLGYYQGVHAPGVQDLTGHDHSHATHIVYLAHGKAVPIIRANSTGSQVGIVLNMWPIHPATDTDRDRAAAHRQDGLTNRWYADPIFKGEYPADVLAMLGKHAPAFTPDEMKSMSAPLDFLGINYYFREVVADDPTSLNLTKTRHVRVEPAEYSDMDWEVYPDGLREVLVRVHRDYQPKAIYVTENGCAQPDVIDARGEVHDPRRVAYLRSHFEAARQAIQQGVPLRGFFVWSLLDNYEWAHGYAKRFGITYVDYPTQRRIPKDSYHYYQQTIRANELV